MDLPPVTRRTALKAAAGALAALPVVLPDRAEARRPEPGWVSGSLTGARALVDTLGRLCWSRQSAQRPAEQTECHPRSRQMTS